MIERIAESTPFLRRQKINRYRQESAVLTKLSNDLVYRNPGGYVEVYANPSIEDTTCEVNRILSRPALMWRHWPSLLIALIGFDEVDRSIGTVIDPIIR